MRKTGPWLVRAALAALSAAGAGAFAAEPAYPQRAIRLIVPQAAGGGSDTIARFMAQKLGDVLGQQAVDFLCYNARDARDRYNAANTMKMAQSIYLNTGTVLYELPAEVQPGLRLQSLSRAGRGLA